MSQHHKIDYVEFPACNLVATKAFFATVFGWDFVDYGPGYTCFTDQGLSGGFYESRLTCVTATGGALIVLYSEDLEATQASIEQAGGDIVKPVFAFPGGRRFHFREPSGNEFAIWTDR